MRSSMIGVATVVLVAVMWTLVATPSASAATGPFGSFLLHTGTAIDAADGDANFQWAAGDKTGDGVMDLIGIKTNLEAHVLTGPAYNSFALQSSMGVFSAGSAYWKWVAGNFDGDGIVDLAAIKTRFTDTGRVELELLTGASHYQRTATIAIPIAATDGDANFQWAFGDIDGDCISELAAIKTRNTGSGRVEVHALSGASRYQTYLTHAATPIAEADGYYNFKWAAGDINGDRRADLFGVKTTNTTTGHVEVHVLNGIMGWKYFLSQTVTPILENDGLLNFKWAAGDINRDGIADLAAIKTRNTATGTVELHVLNGGAA